MKMQENLNMGNTDKQNRRISTAERVFELVELIQKLDRATFTELADCVEISDSTLYNYLDTLTHVGYVSKVDGKYVLSLQFLDRGVHARNRYPVLSKSRSNLKQLADETDSAVWLLVEERGKAVYLAQELGDRSIETHERLGKHEYMHCLASGKAMLAFSPEEHVQRVVEQHGLPQKTPESISEMAELEAELEEVREQGYAINEHETAEGVSAVAAPVVADGEVRGAIAIAEPTARIKRESYRQRLIELVTTASNEIELKLTYE